MRQRVGSMGPMAAAVLLLALCGVQNRRLISAWGDRAIALPGAPPTVTFVTVVLGGFRGLVADVLWLRASRLQEEGRFFELVQLADWITQMEPHAVQVWAYHAWNMAYNISLMMPEDEARWRWVSNGVRLLRDRALRMNPGASDLYAELAWLLHHKIAAEMDPSHPFFKRQFAREVAAVLPDGRLASATPATYAELARTFGLQEERLRRTDRVYGPLDWRAADAHTVYWADLGQTLARNDGRARLRCDRARYQAMARLFFAGRVADLDGGGGNPMRPHPELLPRVVSCFESVSSAHPDDEGVMNAYAGFLMSATLYFDARRDARRGRSLFASLKQRLDGHGVTMPGYREFVEDDDVFMELPPYAFEVVHRLRKERP